MEELKQETFTEEEIKLARELGLENFDEKPRRKVGVPGVYSDPNREVPAAPPKVIYGESALTSRGYSVHRMVNAIRERDWRYAKVENEVHEILERIGYRAQHGGRLIPLDVRFLASLPEFQKLGLDELWAAGVETRAQGESDLTKGGFLLAPERGDIIELMRAQAVVEQAGATVVTMPPSGQLDFPKVTSGGTGYWVGEGLTIPESEMGFGLLQLRSKFVAVLMAASNRSLRHSEGLLEDIMRKDMAAVLALKQDLAFLQGAGTATEPKGIINWSGVVPYDKASAALVAEDILNVEELVEANNGKPPFAWIFNTKVKNQVRKLRAGALKSDNSPDYTVGPFLFVADLVAGEKRNLLNGYPTFVSTQIPVTDGKTYAVFGMFSEAIIAREPVLEIAASEHAGFAQDMTQFKAILGVDFGLRTENVFVHIKNIAV
jgi:HK97 family phage major capsid protein